MGTRYLAGICCLILGGIGVSAEPARPAVLAKLQAERIAPVRLGDASPRTVVAFLHDRLAEHARREGYQLVWEVPEDLPNTPKVLFGVENGTLALLMAAATRFADLATTTTDQGLTVHARVLDEALRETRHHPVREEFWQTIRPRSPEQFFQELGIEFPKGTSARLSPDHRELTVTHNPETLALVEEILRVTFAYPCHWQLRLSIIDSSGHEAPFAEPLVLVPKAMARSHHEGPEAGEVVTVSAQEKVESREERIIHFALETQTARQGRTVRRENTALVLADGVGTVLDLGRGEQLRVVAEFRAADGTPYPSGPPDAPEPPSLSAETQRQLEITLPRFEADEEPAYSVLQRIAAVSREHDPQSRGIGIAYVFEPERLLDDRPKLSAADPELGADPSFPAAVSISMDSIPVYEPLRYVALSLGILWPPVDQGVLLLPDSAAGIPLERKVIGPGTEANCLVRQGAEYEESRWEANDEQAPAPPAPQPSEGRRIQASLAGLGVGFTARAHIDCAKYAASRVIVVTNSGPAMRRLEHHMQTLDSWRVYSRIWHTEVRLVRLPATVPVNELESGLAAAARGNAGPLLAQADATVFVAQTTAFGGGTAVCRLPGTGQQEGTIVLTTCTTNGPSRNDRIDLRLAIGEAERELSWHSALNARRNEWPEHRVWQVFRADPLDPARSPGERSFLLFQHSAQPLWPDGSEEAEAKSQAAATETGKPRGKDPFWNLLFMVGLAEAGEQVTWETWDEDPWNQRDQSNGDRVRMWMEQDGRQCRLRLTSADRQAEVVECAFGFGTEASLPVPGKPGGSVRVTAAETIKGERIALRWRMGRDWPEERELPVGETVPLVPGIAVQVEVVGSWYMEPLEPGLATAVRGEEEYRCSLLEQHRAVLDRWSNTRIADYHLHDVPLSVALARIGELTHAQIAGVPPTWRIDQPIIFGEAPEGAEFVPWPRNQPEARPGNAPARFVWGKGTDSDDDDDTGNDNAHRRMVSIPPDRHRSAYWLTCYRLPVTGKRASFDQHNVTLPQLLAALEQAYGVPLYLREKDGEMLVRAAPLFHTARFGVRTAALEPKTQPEFRAWLQERGIRLTTTDQAVLFRPLDTVVAWGSTSFIQRLDQVLNHP